jgi:pilus assembly protein CpaC
MKPGRSILDCSEISKTSQGGPASMKPFKKFLSRLSGTALLLMVLLVPGAFASSQTPAVTDLVISPDTCEITLATQGPIEYGYFPLSDPDRLIFDFPGAELKLNGEDKISRKIENATFNEINLTQFSQSPLSVRLVVYLAKPSAAAVDYNEDKGIITIKVIDGDKLGNNPESTIPDVDRTDLLGDAVTLNATSETTPAEAAPALSTTPTGPASYKIIKGKDDVAINFQGIDPANIEVEKLSYPDRLHIRMFTKGSVQGSLPRFDPLDHGNIWNSIAKQWTSYQDRNGLGIIDITIHLYPEIGFTRSIDSNGNPQILLMRLVPGFDNEKIKEVDVRAAGEPVVPEIKTQETGPEVGTVSSETPAASTEAKMDKEIVESGKSEIVDSVETVPGTRFGTIEDDATIIPAGDNNEDEAEIKLEVPKPVNMIGDELAAGVPLFMEVGQVRVIPVDNLVRASAGNPAIVTLNVVSQNELLITALAAGTTTLLTWNASGDYSSREVIVLTSTEAMQFEIDSILNNPDIHTSIVMAGDTVGVVLEGAVQTEEEAIRASSIAALFAGENRVTNLLEVSQPRQVMVKVRMVEINKRALDQKLSQTSIGLRSDTEDFTFGIITDLLDPENPGGGLMDTRVKPGIVNGDASDVIFDPIDAFLSELESSRDGNLLSEPNLISLSGHPAHFRVGGEIPYTYQNSEGVNVVEFREFGIALDITPQVDSQGNIRLKVAPTVRTVDMALAIAGIPGFRTREVTTDVQLHDGETLVIGGLIEHEITKIISKVPFLSDIPVLGDLFKSKRFNDDETELVIFLTPVLIEYPDEAEEAVGIYPDPAEITE